MHPLDYFQQIYIINLPHRRDRREEMAEQLEKIGLGLESPNVCVFRAVRPEDAGGFPSIGTRGCFLSHLGVLRDACQRQLERILIFEDDLNFVSDFRRKMSEVTAMLQREDWSLFYGGFAMDSPPEPVEGQSVFKVNSSESITNAHFIAFRGPVILEMANFLDVVLSRPPGDPDGGPMHVDGAYAWYRNLHPEKITLLATPQLGYQRSSRTDIHALRWFDRAPGVRSAVGVIRRWKNRKRRPRLQPTGDSSIGT